MSPPIFTPHLQIGFANPTKYKATAAGEQRNTKLRQSV